MFTPFHSRSANAYKVVGIETGIPQADPHTLVNMLFEGLLQQIGAARSALARGDIKAKCKHIVSAVRLLEEGLKGGLNHSAGGTLAQTLQDIYDFCEMRLTQANVRNDDRMLDEVRQVIEPIADAWKRIGGAVPVPERVM
ncbi:flagellar export chaperone FliS [Candidatus Symbiobacter mobilis]|uniref:Flagellar secretion chaperone FliS n=1 Tax=Candidatus Symbiobacter mobilis CR TaxID=946483 RepID=U5NBC9_9BURK|nr:flagellar export chaperone FliS [Candidatus Symbiobacter mobilis]AGX87479.1 flagellin protein FliS [Candidatus Symbiobacter mobilis CR]